MFPSVVLLSHYCPVQEIYKAFGGSHHHPHQMFLEQTRIFYGKELVLFNPTACRYASFFIRAMRILHVKQALRGTVHSAKYAKLGLTAFGPVNAMVNSDLAFDQRSIVLKASFPLLKIICLGDQQGPGMDKLWYYVIKTEEHLVRSADLLNNPNYFPDNCSAAVPELEGEDPDQVDIEGDPPEYESDDEVMEEEIGEDDIPPTQHLEENLGVDKDTFAGQMIAVWLRYKPNFDFDYACAGYMLSIVPEIREHSKVSEKLLTQFLLAVIPHNLTTLSIASLNQEHAKGKHISAVDSVIKKLYHHLSPTELAQVTDAFWGEYESFKSATGVFSMDYLWSSQLVKKGQTAMWHKQYSVPRTKYLGVVACHVTSKQVGTGMSERVWKDVRIVNSCQCCGKIGSDALEKQATLYGSAKLKKSCALGGTKIYNWADMDHNLGLEELKQVEHERPQPEKRVFNAWIEDWEKEILQRSADRPVRQHSSRSIASFVM